MADPRGFLKHDRQGPSYRAVPVRLRDWKEVQAPLDESNVATQASRCMDCGIPFCMDGCPLGNIIPDWNDLVYRDRWREAIDRLHATNNFPEFTGRLCPAPCEGACVLGINQDPVTIKQSELAIVEHAWNERWIRPVRTTRSTGRSVAIIGSGPAGLAAAQQLTRSGHRVSVLERSDRLGGLLRYGIPEFKMEKRFIDRRISQMRAEGTEFRTRVNVGVDVTMEELRKRFDAVVVATGSTRPRDLDLPGRALAGIHQAMDYLPLANRVQQGDLEHDELPITATGKKVVIIGGGDTGADCLGTAHRQGAESIMQFEIMPEPPTKRAETNPWPTWPVILRTSSAHEEGGDRVYSINTLEFLGDGEGNVSGLKCVTVESSFVDGRMTFTPVEGSERIIDADLVLLAMGFVGPETTGPIDELNLDVTPQGNISRNDKWMTSTPGVFVCGDAGRGQSLIVWAISEGRACAESVDQFLMGESSLPSPVLVTDVPLR